MLSPSSPGSEAALPRRWQWLRKAAGAAMVAVGVLWGVFLAAWLTLHWAILPHIDEWRPGIERLASRSLGLKLSLGEIRVRSSGWVPAFELQDLRVYDSDGREALHLQRVHAALAPQSLLTLSLRFEQILVDGARLQVRRDVQGRWHVAGLDWAGSIDSADTRARDWFLRQREFVVRRAELHWNDERAGVPPLVLSELDLVLRNGLRSHALRLDATPPPQWGQRFSLRGRFNQPLLAPPGELRRWSGTLYAEFPQADVAALRRHVTLPFELGEGDGALRAWVDIAGGNARQATLDFALRAVSLRLAPALQLLQLQQLQGRVAAERSAAGIQLRAQDLAFLTGDGLSWPAGDLSLAWQQAQDLGERWTTGTPVTGGEFGADHLDLEVMASMAERVPLGKPLRTLLAGLAPRGTIDNPKARWSGALDQPATYQVDARLRDLTLQAAAHEDHETPGRPGVRQAQIELSASERGGQAKLALRDGALVFPGLWEQPELPLHELDAALSWRFTPVPGRPATIELKLAKARFANADLRGEADATWTSGSGEGHGRGARFPGRLDLSARLQQVRAQSVARYLPLGIAEGARHHVRDAIQGGSVRSASFKVKGDLWDFPFESAREGDLRVVLQVQDLVYAYLPAPWPAVEQGRGEIEFDRLAMKLNRLQGRQWGYELRDVQGGIADLSAEHPLLTLQGHGRGPAADLLRFARLAPASPRIGAALEPLSITGPSELTLAVRIPLAPDVPNTLQGSVQLAGNELRLQPDVPALQGARGRIDITPQGLTVPALTARWLGGETSFEGSIATDGALRFGAAGAASADGLREWAPLARFAAPLRGQAAWRGTLHAADGRNELTLQSNLVGMQIELPAPLAKPVAATPLPLRVQLSPLADADTPAGRTRDQLQFELGEVLKAQFQRESSASDTRVLRGSVAVQDALPPLPPSGVQAALKLGRVDLEAWQAAAERQGAGGEAAANGYLPQHIGLRADELRAGSGFLSHVQATISRNGPPGDALWRAQVESDQLAGELEYRAPLGGAQAGRVMARLQRLSVPASERAPVEALPGPPPASVPALDIVVDQFEWRGRLLGRLQVAAENRQLPNGLREWQLERLELDTPHAQLRSSGRWSAGGARRMALDFKLDLSDSGAFLERLGAGQALRGGRGQLSGQLSWAGSPLALDYPSLEGQLRVDVAAGQFLHAEPGGARLLGVLSLQALPRRLSLDFRDLFQQGFAFDSVDGDLKVARGVAQTDNLRMRGAQATVLTQGSADLRRETQDLRVWVVPNFDAAGAALATMAINPAIGLGTLLAQWALREPLIAANTRELHITGSWADPDVRRIERNAGAAAPAPAAAPPSEKRPPG